MATEESDQDDGKNGATCSCSKSGHKDDPGTILSLHLPSEESGG
jgi:hypothetical protein